MNSRRWQWLFGLPALVTATGRGTKEGLFEGSQISCQLRSDCPTKKGELP